MKHVYRLNLTDDDGTVVDYWTVAIVPLPEDDTTTVPDYELKIYKDVGFFRGRSGELLADDIATAVLNDRATKE